MRPKWRSVKHARQVQTSLMVDCAALRNLPVADVNTETVLGVLQPIWQTKPESASRVRQRIEAVLDAAKAHGFRSGENPARWRGHLDKLLPKRQRIDRGHYVAMDYDKVPAFMASLRKLDTVAAAALAFLILTAGRRGEILGATWPEVDLDTKVWTVPAGRMKAGREHRVPLSDAALDVLERMATIKLSPASLIFPGRKFGRPLSGKTVNRLLDGIAGTPHGMRSAFRDWAGNETDFPRELAEHALAHRAGLADGRKASDLIDFKSYVDLALTKTHMRIGRAAHDTGEVGEAGYYLAGIEFVGFLVGGAATLLIIRGMPECAQCGAYVRKLKTTMTPALPFQEAPRVLDLFKTGDLKLMQQLLAWRPEERKLEGNSERAIITYDLYGCPNCKSEVITASVRAFNGKEWKDVPSLSARRKVAADVSLRDSFK